MITVVFRETMVATVTTINTVTVVSGKTMVATIIATTFNGYIFTNAAYILV